MLFGANDYKCNLILCGICSASASYPCSNCLRKKTDFGKPSEALQRHRNPNKAPSIKDAPLRVGDKSLDQTHQLIAKWNGHGALNLSGKHETEINEKGGSVFNPPLLVTDPQKNTGEPTHLGMGCIDHFNKEINIQMGIIDDESEWQQYLRRVKDECLVLMENFAKPKAGESTEYSKLCKENQALYGKAIAWFRKAEKLADHVNSLKQEQSTATENDDMDIDLESDVDGPTSLQQSVDAAEEDATKALETATAMMNDAIQKSDDALQLCNDHADSTHYAHLNKLKRGLSRLSPLIIKHLSGSDSKPRGRCQYGLRSAIKATGGKFLVQHGGNSLTNDNGMDVISRYSNVAELMNALYPAESPVGQKIRKSFDLYVKVSNRLSPQLAFIKSQNKCEEKKFMDILDPFLVAWDDAFPNKLCFLRKHHLSAHGWDFICLYGMFGILSAESMEALHVHISQLKELSASQDTQRRIYQLPS
jgi:hypothetical protein